MQPPVMPNSHVDNSAQPASEGNDAPLLPAVSPEDCVLITGATGFVGSHVAERLTATPARIRTLVRSESDVSFLRTLNVECVAGSMTDPDSLSSALAGVTHVVHCAAKVGDWGPVEDYRDVNVTGLKHLLQACESAETVRQFIHMSSLGVYPARDHHGTDETAPVNRDGIDGYTLSKVEAEDVLRESAERRTFPVVILRPGFIYGPRDRIVMPRLLTALREGKVKFLGSGDQLLNQIYVGNLVDAVMLAWDRKDLDGQTFNLTDGQLVTRKEFFESICRAMGWKTPHRHVPLWLARPLAGLMETTARLRGAKEAPLLSQARIKFLGLNLDFSIDRATEILGYRPKISFSRGIAATMEWFQQPGQTTSATTSPE